MELSTAANYFDKESFSTFDSSAGTWTSAAFTGRIAPVDRFLSNFSRPLHRRLLICNVSEVLPTSGTIRHDITGDIYIIGQGRYDAYTSSPYQAIYMLHLVSGLAGGLATVTRRVPQGPANDPGWLVTTTVGTYYVDIELRGATAEEGTVHQMAGQFFLMAAPEVDLQEWDYFALAGNNYRVEEPYSDSGLRFARVIDTEDDRVDLVYNKTTGFSYTPGGGPVTNTQAYNVTGSVHGYKQVTTDPSRVEDDSFRIIVPTVNIGFDPKPRETMTVKGEAHTILEVSIDPLNHEWIIVCQV